MRILANDGISQSGVDALRAGGLEIITDKVDQDALIEFINSNAITGLLVRSATTVRRPLIDACPNLMLIGRGGVGMDNIDVEYARSIGREVINTPAASSQSVAELAMTHMFNMARSVYDSNRLMPAEGASAFKELKKKYGKGVELRGKKLGIIGFGRIGQSLAKYAFGVGMEVLANDSYLGSSIVNIELDIHGIDKVVVPIQTIGLSTLLADSDFISIHIPMPADGSPVISTVEINKMKDGVCLINSARGGVIDENALIQALDSGKVSHAALDVYNNEPNPAGSILSHPKISLTPHVGAATMEAQERIGTELAEKIIAYFG